MKHSRQNGTISTDFKTEKPKYRKWNVSQSLKPAQWLPLGSCWDSGSVPFLVPAGELCGCSLSLFMYLLNCITCAWGLPWWLRGSRICLQCGRPGFNPWVGKLPWRRKQQCTPVFLPGKSHGHSSLVGYGTRSCKELDTTEHRHTPGVCGVLKGHSREGSSMWISEKPWEHSRNNKQVWLSGESWV